MGDVCLCLSFPTWGMENKGDVYCFCRICVFGCSCEALNAYSKTGGS